MIQIIQNKKSGEIIAIDLENRTSSIPLHYSECQVALDVIQLDEDLTEDFDIDDWNVFR